MRVVLSRCIVAVACLVAIGASADFRVAMGAPSLPPAREGCMNQWMFNGVWRVRVTKVDPLEDNGKQIGWMVTEQWRNGTRQTFSPNDTFAKDQALVLANGSVITATETTVGTLSAQDVGYHGFPPSAQYTHVQRFIASGSFDPSVKPAAVVIAFDASKLAEKKTFPQYTVNPPNYRIKLDCTASGQQGAQGGSFELPAKEGCINQWLANGFWKFRVTRVGPQMDSSGTQVGWQVAQDWVNISGRKLEPGNTAIGDEQLVLANEDTVSSGNLTTTTLNYQQLTYHDFNPGASYSHVQTFGYNRPAFDPANKPAKLIVFFDEDRYKYFAQKPMPVHPPNFRIKFDCTK